MNDLEPLQIRPIGIVRSPLKTAVGSPLQPRAAAGVTGTIELDPVLAPALSDLAGFSRIWVLYWFHRATPAKLVIKPYRDDHEHGLFATRVPARPNPIGLSTVALIAVDGANLCVGDLDILDGTPVLDIKPYVPEYDAYPSEKAGWLASASRLWVKVGDERFQCASDQAVSTSAECAGPRNAAQALRVAVASLDGKTVHQHFGRATQFLIFDIHEGRAHFIEARLNAPICRGAEDPGDESPSSSPRPINECLVDCAAVIVAAIGAGARHRLAEHGIRAFVARDFIDAALARVAHEVAETQRTTVS